MKQKEKLDECCFISWTIIPLGPVPLSMAWEVNSVDGIVGEKMESFMKQKQKTPPPPPPITKIIES